jgi:branched-chain amino acid transport system ATP-binding protein
VSAQVSPDIRSPANDRGAQLAPILQTERLSVRFGGLSALSDVNFQVRRDDVHAIIGPNGAGKSTFFNCLTGVLRPSGGRIVFNGENITGLPSNAISQKGIARSYQITNILPNVTALENVRIAAQSRRHSWNMFAHHGGLADISSAISRSALRLPPSRSSFASTSRPRA